MNMKQMNLVAVMLAAVATGACAASGTQRSTGEVVDDATVTARVKAALIDDPTTKARQIDVSTNRGTVELAGTVDSQSAKGRAAQIAQRVEGVGRVENKLMVSAGERSAGAVIDDAALTAKVKAALIANDLTKARQINVDTREGVVQLHGFVDSNREANEAVKEARAVNGVKEVKNDLEVKSSSAE